jgi:cysteinyl-tRNA synthetase
MSLELYNTLKKTREPFVALEAGKVRMYNCGPTVYSYAHIGNFASFLMADLVRRYLEFSGYQVLQVMNITDVGHLTDDENIDAQGEDKLEKKAREEKKNPWEIARFYEAAFHEDRQALNLLPAHHFPRATDHIPEMVEIIEELLAKGLAYIAGDQVYFEISKFPAYGMLSGNTPEQLMAGNRVEVDPQKRSPLDFCLWKKDPKHIMKWDSPWGEGFPGWHIECSAMSRKYLGEVFDIHTGGEDNIFPHHECEIAQSSGGENRICSRYWLHRRHILVDGKKMSKRLGNFYTIRDLVARGYSGAEIRYALLSTHYRQHYNFSLSGLDGVRESLRRLREFLRQLAELPALEPSAESASRRQRLEALVSQADGRFREALDDDLNISGALAAVFEFAREARKLARSRLDGEVAAAALRRWDGVLGFIGHSERPAPFGLGPLDAESATADDPEAAEFDRLLALREAARKARDFAEADRLRAELKRRGALIKDTPQGSRWFREERR